MRKKAHTSNGSGVANAVCKGTDDDDEEEVRDLLPPRGKFSSPQNTNDGSRPTMVNRWTAVGAVCAIALLFFKVNSSSPSVSSEPSKVAAHQHHQRQAVFSCPKTVLVPENYDETFKDDYNRASQEILRQSETKNETEFLDLLLNYSGFDGWTGSYENVKANLFPWKSEHFVPHIFEGASVYESASGVGLNLYMTLEILRDLRPEVGDVEINGNEYVDESTRISNILYDKFTPPNARKGVLCTADSMKLEEFVPEAAFDIVYTGYISTLLNPLNLTFGDLHENRKYYTKLCKADQDDWRSQKLAEIAQERQEEWFSRWVQQMTRIAKPGAPVIIEQVALPYCDMKEDWGGVPRAWWANAIQQYSSTWDVDPDSLFIATAEVGLSDDDAKKSRYNVFMRKNAPK